MKYLYKVYPLPELVYIFVYNNSRVSLNLLYITIDGHAEPGFIFLLQNTSDPDQPAPYLIMIHTVVISACKYMQFDN